jgi:hypothetical protein
MLTSLLSVSCAGTREAFFLLLRLPHPLNQKPISSGFR